MTPLRTLLLLPLMLSLLAACPASKSGDEAQDPNADEPAPIEGQRDANDSARAIPPNPNKVPPAPPVAQTPNAVQQPNGIRYDPNSNVHIIGKPAAKPKASK